MPQNLIQLPKEAEFEIAGWPVIIHNYKVPDDDSMFGSIIWVVNKIDPGRKILNKFEKHGVSFEAAIECCIKELEVDAGMLVFFFKWMYKIRNSKELAVGFSKSKGGKLIADQYMEKIRSCNNWEELYDELHHTSKFQKDMKNRIIPELKEQNRIKEEIK